MRTAKINEEKEGLLFKESGLARCMHMYVSIYLSELAQLRGQGLLERKKETGSLFPEKTQKRNENSIRKIRNQNACTYVNM